MRVGDPPRSWSTTSMMQNQALLKKCHLGGPKSISCVFLFSLCTAFQDETFWDGRDGSQLPLFVVKKLLLAPAFTGSVAEYTA